VAAARRAGMSEAQMREGLEEAIAATAAIPKT
jgi:hypothetical protein